MSDNIRNFNDYRKKINRDEQATEEINIQIQDPLDFLSAEEREEYYRTQHEAMDRERQALYEDSDEFYFDEDFHIEEPEVHEEEYKEPEPVIKKKSRPEHEKEKSQAIRKRTAKEAVKEKKRPPKKAKARDEEDEEDEIIPLIIVRISSIITGIIILVLIGLIFKSKVYDTYFGPEPDEEAQVETAVGELAGYTRTDDKIITTAALNLRNTPSVASDDFIVVQVPEGTVLDRVSVSDDGEWAQVKYEDQLLFCVMKYATVQE